MSEPDEKDESLPQWTPEEQAMFDEDLNSFYNLLDKSVQEGRMTFEQAERFFPESVRQRIEDEIKSERSE